MFGAMHRVLLSTVFDTTRAIHNCAAHRRCCREKVQGLSKHAVAGTKSRGGRIPVARVRKDTPGRLSQGRKKWPLALVIRKRDHTFRKAAAGGPRRSELMAVVFLRQARRWVLAVAVTASAATGLRAGDENVSPDADFTVRQITQDLFKAKAGERLDYAGRDLTYLDLSGLDFKQASLARTDLYGVDFTGSNLKGADISHARLDRAVLIRADLSGANLSGASIYRPTVYSDMHNSYADAPRFAGSNLTGIRVQADLSGADFRGADLTAANFSPLEGRPGQGTLVTLARNVLKSCNFSGATLRRADLTRAVLMFSSLVGADLTDANLSEADLSKVDFSGANLSGANVTGADFDGANLAGVKGLESVKGMDQAVNLDKAFR